MRYAVSLACVAAAALACRRDADAPLPAQHLFPDVAVAAPQQTASAAGSVTRAERLAEAEPNDSVEHAQPLSADAIVAATLQAAAPPPADEAAPPAKSAKGAKKPKNPPKTVVIDQDWYRLPAVPPGQVLQVELRNAAACAELQVFDDAGKKLLRKGRTVKGVRPVFGSLASTAGASAVRVLCEVAAGKAAEPEARTYELAVFSRPLASGEELEPNDAAAAKDAPVAAVGATLQGTLSPEGDVDAFAIATAGSEAGAPMVLSATGPADVEWQLAIAESAGAKPWLVRKLGKNQSALIANVDWAGLPATAVVQLTALKGQAPDTPYAFSLQPYLPAGCAKAADCPALLPVEREPNDAAEHPFAVAWSDKPQTVTALLSGGDDVDWYAVQVPRDQACSVRVRSGRAERALQLQWVASATSKPVTVAVPAGTVGALPAIAGTGAAVLLAVRAADPSQPAANEPYQLEIAPLDPTAWEAEAGDETQGGLAWQPAAALLPFSESTGGVSGGWQRRGVLFPAGDRDAFSLDLRARTAPLGLELQCSGDGAADLTCIVQDVAGRPMLTLPAPATGEAPAKALINVPPTALRIVVQAGKPRPSATPYSVVLRIAAEAASLPVAGTVATE